MIHLTDTAGTIYTLDDNGAVTDRTNGPRGWDYSGKWVIVGFKTRHNARRTVSLRDALNGENTGQGWIVDNDHGTLRLWGGTRLRSLRQS